MNFRSISTNSAGSLYVKKLLQGWGFDCHLLEFGKSKVKPLCFFMAEKDQTFALPDILM